MNPLLRNHFVHEVPENLGRLLILLAKEKSIYFAPLNRVMPTAFFKGHIWYLNSLRKHLSNGSFRRAEIKDAVSRRRIRSLLNEIPIPKN